MKTVEYRTACAACALAIARAGGAAELARRLAISRAAVSKWDIVPIARVAEVEEITGVSRAELRPDYYGSEVGQ